MDPRAGAPQKSRSKRRTDFVQATKNRSGKLVGVPVGKGVGRRPDQERVARRPDLAQAGIDPLGDCLRIQNFRKRARIDNDVKPTDDEHRGLGIRSGSAVWVDGPTLHALMFGE